MTALANVTITSFGFGHGLGVPPADVVADVRRYRDPHFDPALRELTADDDRIRRTVLSTPGVEGLIGCLADLALMLARTPGPVRIAIGCGGGRHRAPTIARELYGMLHAEGITVRCEHRDMHLPVITRPGEVADNAGDQPPAAATLCGAEGRPVAWETLPESDRQAVAGFAAFLRQRHFENVTGDDPSQVDWEQQRRHALIPFRVVDGRPLNPAAPTGIRYGRGGHDHWGEGLAADAIVLLDLEGRGRRVLLVERGDGLGWAIPGGHVDPGETGLQAAVRELREETGLTVPAGAEWRVLEPRIVPDPRSTDESWMVTTPCVVDLGEVTGLPDVVGDDDADEAAWIPADSYDELVEHLVERGGTVFAAHTGLLQEVLDGGNVR